MTRQPAIWALTTGEAGMTTQARALAVAIAERLLHASTLAPHVFVASGKSAEPQSGQAIEGPLSRSPQIPRHTAERPPGVADADGSNSAALEVRVVRAVPPRILGVLPVSWWMRFFPRAVLQATRVSDAATGAPIDLSAEHAPALIVTCGRRSARIAAALRQVSRAAVRGCGDRHRVAHEVVAIHVQDPRMALRYFDAVVVSAHDAIAQVRESHAHGDRIWVVSGALHDFTSRHLNVIRKTSAADFPVRFAALPRPWVAVALGGSTRRFRFDRAQASAWGERLAALLAREQGSVLVTSSRRMNPAAWKALRAGFERATRRHLGGVAEQRAWWHAAHAEDASAQVNPYPGMLAWADAWVVSGDSVSMVSEALATGRPVAVLEPSRGVRVFGRSVARFHAQLVEQGRVQRLVDDVDAQAFAQTLVATLENADSTSWVGGESEHGAESSDVATARRFGVGLKPPPRGDVFTESERVAEELLRAGVLAPLIELAKRQSDGR